MKSTKKIALSIAVILSVTFAAIGMSALEKPTDLTAKAEDNATMTVDTLGNLEWEEVSGATGYEWTYTVGGVTSEKYAAEDNEANVGVALTKAAQEARADSAERASVQFNVTATGVANATTMTYTHSFTQYIDYGYATHDFADVKASAKTPTKLVDLALDGDANFWVASAMFKNDVLTMGIRTDAALSADGIYISLFGPRANGDGNLNQYNYRIRLQQTGKLSLAVKSALNSYLYNFNAGETYNTAVELGKPYYLSMAVFDTYDLTGAIVGETVYFERNVYDSTADELVEVGGFSQFIDSATLTEKGVAYTTDSTVNASANTMQVDLSAILIKTRGYVDEAQTDVRANYVYAFSGIPDYTALEAPTGLYYDNSDATFNWNSVKGASGYQWRVGNGAWQNLNVRKVDVESLLSEYLPIGYLPLSVRAVGGKTASYNLDLERFYNSRSEVVDFVDFAIASSNLSTQVKRSETDRYYTGGKCYQNTGLTYGKHVTFAFEILAESSATSMISLGLFGPEAFNYANRYYLVIIGDGTVQLGNFISKYNFNANDRPKSKYWRVANVADGFLQGNRYYVTYGIDEVYEDGIKVADRLTVRIEQEENKGLDRRTIGIVTYDNKMFATEGYALETEQSIQFNAPNDYCATYMAQGDTDYRLDFTVNGEEIVTKTVDYGAYYDFNDVNTSALTVPQGYEMDGWIYEQNGKTYAFPLSGKWNIAVDGALEIKANLLPIEYNVSYDVASGNSTKYTIVSDETLQEPEECPIGKIFDAWYETSDTDFSNPITTLKGKTGDVSLTARFVDGYTVTVFVDGVEMKYAYKTGDAPMTLSAPDVQHKTFVGWKVLSGSEYVDYQGPTTFVPTSSRTFKAEYEWTKYTITYIAEGATNENATSYTVNETLTFVDAKKAGYFFVGWYEEDEYLTKVTDTKNYMGGVTLYARFIENSLPATLKLDRSKAAYELPVPVLPQNAEYTVKLYVGENELTIENGKYTFDKAGIYTLKYTVLLQTGETLTHTVALTVDGIFAVNVHYGNGKMITLKKSVGEKLLESDLPAIVEGYQFGGVYIDSTYQQAYDMDTMIAEDMNVYVKWIPVEIVPVENESLLERFGCASNMSTSIGLVGSFVLGVALVCLLKKKETL